jgi:hypothetical protein
MPYGSVPPASPAAGRFGTTDTAISPGSSALPGSRGSGEALVEVVTPPRRGVRVPLVVAILLALVVGLIGFAAGILVGQM